MRSGGGGDAEFGGDGDSGFFGFEMTTKLVFFRPQRSFDCGFARLLRSFESRVFLPTNGTRILASIAILASEFGRRIVNRLVARETDEINLAILCVEEVAVRSVGIVGE